MKKSAGAVAVCLLLVAQARAVILFDTGDPTVNTTAPGGTLANSGWQYEADWGGFLGTPIAPNFFISAAHIGQAGSGPAFQGTTYSVVGSFSLAGSDLQIWKVGTPFGDFAPLYTKRDEAGQHLVVIGRGTQRGAERMLDGTLRGWNWGPDDSVRRWGENDVAEIVPFHGHDMLYATFDQHILPNDHPNEAHLSRGDSGGAVFLNDNGLWKVAGINYGVDDLFTEPSPDFEFTAAIFDARGYYAQDPEHPSIFMQIVGSDPVPTGFYASRISSELAWIASVIAEPEVGREAGYLTLTYWRLNAPSTDIVYEVIQSSDLTTWGPAITQDEILTTAGDLQQVKAKIDPGSAVRLFVRLRVTRPNG
jgi:hypothetical protein